VTQFLQCQKLLFTETSLFENLAEGPRRQCAGMHRLHKSAFHRGGARLYGYQSVLLLRIRHESTLRGPHGQSKASGIST
jgi:hypothetical protein